MIILHMLSILRPERQSHPPFTSVFATLATITDGFGFVTWKSISFQQPDDVKRIRPDTFSVSSGMEAMEQ